MEQFDALPCGVFAFDSDLRIAVWNAAMERLTGLSREQAVGQPASIVEVADVSGEGAPIDLLACATNPTAPGLARSVYLKDAAGKRRLAFVQARFSPGGGHSFVTVADISEEVSCELITSPASRRPGAFHGIIGRDEKMQELFRLIRLAADSTASVLITGESGTGKELVARAIHNLSERRSRPFVAVNCSALSETLLESELFGHVRGAFTGAYRDKEGKLESADGGTIFLDEIGDLSPLIQLKLLRVVQEKIIERVGDNRSIPVDMRIVTATNRDLRDLVARGLFREDLYYRLKVLPIAAPPLRDRKADIPLLADHFVHVLSERTGKRIAGVTDDAMRLLMEYCWPGNVREMENAFEYAFVMSQGELIDAFDLPQEIRVAPLREQLCAQAAARAPAAAATAPPAGRHPARQAVSREKLLEALETNRGNRSAAARELGISRVGLWKKMKRLGIDGTAAPGSADAADGTGGGAAGG